MHKVMAILLYYEIKDDTTLFLVIDTFTNHTRVVTDLTYIRTLIMIFEFLKRQNPLLPSRRFENITARIRALYDRIPEIDFDTLKDDDKERFAIAYVNGFSFNFLEPWLQKPRTPFFCYALAVIQYIINYANHIVKNIYDVMYVFMTPDLAPHSTFLDVFYQAFVNVSNQQQLSLPPRD